MAQLHRHPGGLQMRELAQRLMVTGGSVTGLTDAHEMWVAELLSGLNAGQQAQMLDLLGRLKASLPNHDVV